MQTTFLMFTFPLWQDKLDCPFPKEPLNPPKCFELLHVDLWGPYHVHDSYKDLITMVDDQSRSTWTQLLSCKSNALQVIKTYLYMIENQFSTTLNL